MSQPTYLGYASANDLRRLARALVRRARSSTPTPEFGEAMPPPNHPGWTWERAGAWDVCLRVLYLPGPAWALVVRALDERARWEDLPPLLSVMRVPAGTHPLVSPAETPAGEPLVWAWGPHADDLTRRHAPERDGAQLGEEARLLARAWVVARHDAVRALADAKEAARVAAEEQADRDLREAFDARGTRLKREAWDEAWDGVLDATAPEAALAPPEARPPATAVARPAPRAGPRLGVAALALLALSAAPDPEDR